MVEEDIGRESESKEGGTSLLSTNASAALFDNLRSFPAGISQWFLSTNIRDPVPIKVKKRFGGGILASDVETTRCVDI